MSMRVPDGLLSEIVINRINQTSDRVARLRVDISSGYRIHKPSDDPGGALRAASLRSGLEQVKNHQSAVQVASMWLKSEDTALGDVLNLVREVRNLALQGVNPIEPQARDALKKQIDTIHEALVQSANSTNGLINIFGGFQGMVSPFEMTATGEVEYQGDYGKKVVTIIDGIQLTMNHDGREVFGLKSVSDPPPDGADLFSTVRALADAVQAGDTTEVEAQLQALDEHNSRILAIRVETGTRLNQVEIASTRLVNTNQVMTDLLAETEGTDVAEAIVHLKAQETLYQAATYIASTLSQGGLINWLR